MEREKKKVCGLLEGLFSICECLKVYAKRASILTALPLTTRIQILQPCLVSPLVKWKSSHLCLDIKVQMRD